MNVAGARTYIAWPRLEPDAYNEWRPRKGATRTRHLWSPIEFATPARSIYCMLEFAIGSTFQLSRSPWLCRAGRATWHAYDRSNDFQVPTPPFCMGYGRSVP